MIRFVEPVSALMECAILEFPTLSTKVVLVSGMATAEGAWGQTWWPDDSGELHPDWEDGITALVQIDAAASYYAMPDILAHELAHVVAGPDDGHGDVFADAYLRIHAAFCRAHGEEQTEEMLAELHDLIECARTGRPFGTEPAPEPLLMSAENPTGWKLEELLTQLVTELQAKTAKIANDVRPAASTVHLNNLHIIRLLSQAAILQHQSVAALDAVAPDPGPLGTPRIGASNAAPPAALTMPGAAAIPCLCIREPEAGECACDADERALRAWAYNGHAVPMTAEQKAWCADQVRRCSDATDQPDSFDGYTDEQLARAVLSAWVDFARDKGLI